MTTLPTHGNQISRGKSQIYEESSGILEDKTTGLRSDSSSISMLMSLRYVHTWCHDFMIVKHLSDCIISKMQRTDPYSWDTNLLARSPAFQRGG